MASFSCLEPLPCRETACSWWPRKDWILPKSFSSSPGPGFPYRWLSAAEVVGLTCLASTPFLLLSVLSVTFTQFSCLWIPSLMLDLGQFSCGMFHHWRTSRKRRMTPYGQALVMRVNRPALPGDEGCCNYGWHTGVPLGPIPQRSPLETHAKFIVCILSEHWECCNKTNPCWGNCTNMSTSPPFPLVFFEKPVGGAERRRHRDDEGALTP